MRNYLTDETEPSEYALDGIVIVPDVPRNNLSIEIKDNGITKEAVSPKDKVAWKARVNEEALNTTVVKCIGMFHKVILVPRVFYEPVVNLVQLKEKKEE